MRYIALLRGINVGGHKKVPMAELRELAAELGFTNVATYINSGNLFFDAAGKAPVVTSALERGIAERFGFEVPVVVRSRASFTQVAGTCPFAEACEAEPKLVLLLLAGPKLPAQAAEVLREKASAGERVEAVSGGLWLHFPDGSARSKWTPAVLDKAAGGAATTRNWNTVREILARL